MGGPVNSTHPGRPGNFFSVGIMKKTYTAAFL